MTERSPRGEQPIDEDRARVQRRVVERIIRRNLEPPTEEDD